MSTSAVNNAAQSGANASVAAGDSELPKNPLTEGQDKRTSEPDATSTEVTEPLQVAPETHTTAHTPAATTNGNAVVNGAEAKFESLVPEEHKQADTPAATTALENAAPSATGAPVTSEPSATSQPPVMTGANPSASEPKTTESEPNDGVEDVAAAPVAPAAGAAAVVTEKPAELNGGGKKDVEIEDAPSAATALGATSTTAQADTITSSDATSKAAETGEKRKADTDASNGIAAAGEPAEKKQKSTIEKVVDKAKEVVEDVKGKTGNANKDNGPARKNSKRGKKEAPPVGRTERKTRSQARLE